MQTITEGTKTADFVYNADHQRIRMTLKTSGTTTKTRYYFGGSCEREVAGSTTTQYIWIGGDAYSAVAVAKKIGTGSWAVYNIFRDHLGTITHLKNGTNPADEYSFDACSVKLAFWERNEPKSIVERIPKSATVREGRRRDKDSWSYILNALETLGYTTVAGGGLYATGNTVKNFVKKHLIFEAEFRVDKGYQAFGNFKAFGSQYGVTFEKNTKPMWQLNAGFDDHWYGAEYSIENPKYGYGDIIDPIRTTWSAGYFLGASQSYDSHNNFLKVGSLESENINMGLLNISKYYGYNGNVRERQFTLDYGFDFSMYFGINGYIRGGIKY